VEEEESSSESDSSDSETDLTENVPQSSPVEILPDNQEEIHKMLENIRNGRPPCDESPETLTDSVLNALDYKDFFFFEFHVYSPLGRGPMLEMRLCNKYRGHNIYLNISGNIGLKAMKDLRVVKVSSVWIGKEGMT
jgi:hypothetical protein